MRRTILVCAALALSFFIVLVAIAQPQGRAATLHAALDGIQEVPSVSTPGHGSFLARIDERAGMIAYTLTYADLRAPATQAHLHFGERRTNGGVVVFLCSNLGNAPPGTQQCPADPAEITGMITAADVLVLENQGIEAGDFAALLAAIRAGAIYVNVHSEMFPPGEIRGQLD